MEIGNIIKPSKLVCGMWALFTGSFAAFLTGVGLNQHNLPGLLVAIVPLTIVFVGAVLSFGDQVVLGPQRSMEFRTRRWCVRRTTLDLRPMRDGARSTVFIPFGIRLLQSGGHTVFLWPYFGRQSDLVDWAQGRIASEGEVASRATRPTSSGRSARPPESGA